MTRPGLIPGSAWLEVQPSSRLSLLQLGTQVTSTRLDSARLGSDRLANPGFGLSRLLSQDLGSTLGSGSGLGNPLDARLAQLRA